MGDLNLRFSQFKFFLEESMTFFNSLSNFLLLCLPLSWVPTFFFLLTAATFIVKGYLSGLFCPFKETVCQDKAPMLRDDDKRSSRTFVTEYDQYNVLC